MFIACPDRRLLEKSEQDYEGSGRVQASPLNVLTPTARALTTLP